MNNWQSNSKCNVSSLSKMNVTTSPSTVKRRSSVDQCSVLKLFVCISTLICSIKRTIHKTLKVQISFFQMMTVAKKLLNSWVQKTICAIAKKCNITAVNITKMRAGAATLIIVTVWMKDIAMATRDLSNTDILAILGCTTTTITTWSAWKLGIGIVARAASIIVNP